MTNNRCSPDTMHVLITDKFIVAIQLQTGRLHTCRDDQCVKKLVADCALMYFKTIDMLVIIFR